MSTNAERRTFYRSIYLKSDHWSNLRLQKLADCDAKCERCGKRDLSNDVHHLRYRRLYDVLLEDLVVLCRRCHILVHEALELFQEQIKNEPDESKTWIATLRMIVETRRGKLKLRMLRREVGKEGKPPKPLGPIKSSRDEPTVPHEFEMNAVFRELRQQGGFAFLVVRE